MKVQIISDLHQEFGFTDLSFDHSDVVVLAGDVNLGMKELSGLKIKFPTNPLSCCVGK